jgi:hypothetical protein
MAAGQKGRQQAPNFEPLWERLKGQVDWYDRKAKANQRAYKVSKISIIVLAILIPVFAEYGFIPGFVRGPSSWGRPPASSFCSKGSRC